MTEETRERRMDCVMEYYSEALEELMGGQGYAKRAYHSTHPEEKAYYVRMARQELEHMENLKAMAHQKAKDDPIVLHIWGKLQKHLDSWKDKIVEKIKMAESKTM